MPLHQLFEAQVAKTPDSIALIFQGESLTYAELNARANQTACLLRSLGVGPEVPVGLCMERSPELVTALLGIFKAGGACVPVNPEQSRKRINFMLEDTRMPVLLVQPHVLSKLFSQVSSGPALEPHCYHERWPILIPFDRDCEMIARQDTGNLDNHVVPGNLSFVFYTSGSTGRPKGVLWPHMEESRLQAWVRGVYERDRLTADDRHWLNSSVGFTLLSREIFLPLLTGARMFIVPAGLDRDAAYLVNLIARCEITTITVVPSMLATLLERDEIERCASLRHVYTLGESLPVSIQRRLLELLDVELRVIYGATEAPSTTVFRCDRNSHTPIIGLGQPLPGKEIYLLDKTLNSTPTAECGDIYAGGTLARGYLNCPDLTAEKFLPNPFSTEPGARMYQTGDVACYGADGNLQFLGRSDHQVKIRGFRVELGEIEAVLSQHPAVKETVVLARDEVDDAKLESSNPKSETCTEPTGRMEGPKSKRPETDNPKSAIQNRKFDKRLVTYIVPRAESVPSVNELRAFLKEHLPPYMIPSVFVFLNVLPLSANGKIDRKALPPPEVPRPELHEFVIAPHTSIEKMIAAIWAEVLNLDKIGIHDNFFDLGGHSLLAAQAAMRISERLGVEIAVRAVFELPTVAGLADLIDAVRCSGPVEERSMQTTKPREQGDL